MHVPTRSSIVSFALKTLTGAVASALLVAASANAAGLGKLTVLSSLGQPLRAEIELTAVSPEEAGGLVAKLAPADAFRLANIDFNPALMSLRFEVEQRNGRQVIKITSSQAVNEPFVDMLLELNWTGGRMVREYTFLLDPADMRATQPAQVAAPVDLGRQTAPAGAQSQPQPQAQPQPQPQPQPQQTPRASAAPAATPAPVKAAPAAEQPRQAAGEYQVKPGDNLSRIAGQLKPVDVSLDMMLVALYRANPEAFAGNNMNRLKSGQILAVPDDAAIRAVGSDGDARGVVVAHAIDFNAYRAKLAGQVASSVPAKEPDATQSVAGKITAKVEEKPNAVNEAKDKLTLSKATSGTPTAGKTGMAVEDKIAAKKEMDESAARVKELEKNVSDLENLMAVKKKAAAELKKTPASASAVASAAASASAPVASVPVVAAADATQASAPPKPRRTMVVPPKRYEPSLFETLMDNLNYVGLAAAAVLAGVGGIIVSRRRKQAGETRAETSILGETTGMPSQQLIAEAGGQSVDTNNSVFNSNFAPSASQLDTNEVDPVAEADVYIAYGRDAQAEEILKEALRTHPERHAVRLKLLEIYSNRKDPRGFETQASELYALTRGQGDEWTQATVMGQALDPNNPLYAMGQDGASAGVGVGEVVAAGAGLSAAALAAEAFAARPAAESAAAGFGAYQEPAASAGGLDLDLDSTGGDQGNGMDFDSDLTAVPQAPAADMPTPASMAAEADKDQFLDFDLGGLSFDPVTPPAAPAATPAADELADDLADDLAKPLTAEAPSAPAAAAAEDDPFDLSFEPPAAPAAAPAPAPAADDFSMDFGLDLPAAAMTEKSPAPAGDDPLADLDLMDFDIPAPAATAAPTAAPAPDDALDLSGMDLDEEEGEGTAVPPASAPAAQEFDLSGIDLDLDPDLAGGAGAAAAAPAESASAPDARDDVMSAHHMEMDTKLDLAIAYQEIGDKEGARELLDEVIRGGSKDQVAKANTMRAQLG